MPKLLTHIFILWVIWVLLATLLAWAGFFHARVLWLILIVMGIWLTWNNPLRRHRRAHSKSKQDDDPLEDNTQSKFFLPFLLSAFCFLLVNIFFLQPQTFFSGRDQGAISQAAHFLATEHSLSVSLPEADAFFAAYGPGEALNFPGFHYTEDGKLTPHFPHPTIAWYGSLLSLGVPSPYHISLGNAITLALFAVTFFLVLRRLTSSRTATLLTALALATFPLWWFARYSLSENLMLALVWITLFFFLAFLRKPKNLTLLFLVLTGSLLTISRIEGPLFVALMGISLLIIPKTRTWLFQKPFQRLLLPISAVAAILILAIYNTMPFYTNVGQAVLTTLGIMENPASLSSSDTSLSLFSLWGILFLYGIAVIFLVAMVSLWYLLRSRHLSQNAFLILFVLSPTFLYLFFPFISPDHPWMLRRFMFSALPALILIVGLAYHQVQQNGSLIRPGRFLLIFLFVAQIPVLLYFFPIRQDAQLLLETQAFSKNFSEDDLVLIDAESTGDGFVMMPGVLRTLPDNPVHSAYFFNKEDLTRADFSQFDNVYLLAPVDRIDRYTNISDTERPTQLTFTANRLREAKNTFTFPSMEQYSVDTLFLFVR